MVTCKYSKRQKKNPWSFPWVFQVCARKPNSVTAEAADDYLSGIAIAHDLKRLSARTRHGLA
jgi:hypothetical protein